MSREVVCRLTAVLLVWILVLSGCQPAKESDAAARSDTISTRCAREPADSARAVCVGVEVASREVGRSQRLYEFRREPGGFAIVTVPDSIVMTDGELTVHLSLDFRVRGFGPDST